MKPESGLVDLKEPIKDNPAFQDLKRGLTPFYVPDFTGSVFQEAFDFKNHLLNLNWETRRTARHEYFMSDKFRSYTYGNRGLGEELYKSKPFTVEVAALLKAANKILGTEFNVCFLNKYDDEHQHLGWHADDFKGMRQDQPIAVISYGAEREIWFKKKDYKGKVPPEGKCLLEDGSLLS